MVKAVIFDLWGTLGKKGVPVSETLREHFNLEEAQLFARRYARAVQLLPKPSFKELSRSFLREFALKENVDNIEFITKVFQKGISGAVLFDGVKPVLEDLKGKGLKLALLSNTSVFESQVIDAWGVSGLFDVRIFSWMIGSLKPKAINFIGACTRLGVRPEDCIFVDDSLKYVEAAKAGGFKVIRFESVDQLKEELSLLLKE